MEEILASIRQTISAEKESGKSAPADRPMPSMFSRTNGVPRVGTPPEDRASPSPANPQSPGSPQSLGRLSDALKAVQPAPSNGLESKRPSSFDDDLADILGEPLAGSNGVTAPKPSLNLTPDVPGLFVPKPSEPKMAAAPFPSLNGDAAPAPAAKDANEPPRSAPPMRRGGFYPPAGFMPKLPGAPSEPARTNSAAGPSKNPDSMIKRLTALGAVVPAAPFASPADGAPKSVDAPKSDANDSSVPTPSFTAFGTDRLGAPEPLLAPAPAPSTSAFPETKPIPEEPKPVLAEPKSAFTEPQVEPQPLPSVAEAPRAGLLVPGLERNFATSFEVETPAAPVAAEIPQESEAPPPSAAEIEAAIAEAVGTPEPVFELMADEPIVVESVLVEPAVEEPAFEEPVFEKYVPEPAPVPHAAGPSPSLGPAMNGAHVNGAHVNGAHMNGAHASPRIPENSPYAAMAALDALAQGLAASAAARSIPPQAPVAPAPMRSDPYGPPTGALVPVSEPNPRHSGGIPPRPPAANSYEQHQPVRTLEDAVAEMLKPMLQQWLADNMPRIIEKALRVEAASTVKRNQKPPGY